MSLPDLYSGAWDKDSLESITDKLGPCPGFDVNLNHTTRDTLFVMQLINLSEIILKTILKRPTEVIQDLLQPTVFRKYI